MSNSEDKNDVWQRQLLEKIAMTSLSEQRRARRWGVLFKMLTFTYLFVLLFMWLGWFNDEGSISTSGKHTALINIEGVIAPDSSSSAANITKSLRDAFNDKNTQGVILHINSPGGSPVQAGIVNDEIGRLRAINPEVPLYAVIGDVCASGGYYVAVAADLIYVDKASLVGSIGVLLDGFGFTGALDKLGIERRLLTAGESKGFLDPFSPPDSHHLAHAQTMLGEIHEQFIQVVQQGRGDRLVDSPEIYSGVIWTGQKSIELGLADAIGSTHFVAREVIMTERLVDFTAKQGFADRLAKRFGGVLLDIFSKGWELR